MGWLTPRGLNGMAAAPARGRPRAGVVLALLVRAASAAALDTGEEAAQRATRLRVHITLAGEVDLFHV